jgi:hypothetical protein
MLPRNTLVRITEACFVPAWVGLVGRVVQAAAGEVVVDVGGVRYTLCGGSVEPYYGGSRERSETHAAAVGRSPAR